jgi:hypothetical protein
MGGSAHIIEGTVRAEALMPKAHEKSVISRIFGKSKSDAIRRTPMGNSIHIDVPCRGLSEKFHGAFTQYLKHKLSHPNEATASIQAYLSIAKTVVYIRGEEQNGSCTWHTQLTFSGSAGMGDISAEVCSHWAAYWTQDCLADFVRPTLMDYGFEVSDQSFKTHDHYRFICVDLDGRMHYGSVGSDGSVDLDGAIYEGLTDDYDGFNERLKECYFQSISSTVCECQLCEDRQTQTSESVNQCNP